MVDQQLPPALAGDERFALLWEILNDALGSIDLNVMLVYLVDLVKAPLLHVLAEQFSLLDEAAWRLAESEDVRRNLIKSAIELHRYKGTPWSIRQVIRQLGFGEVTLIEGLGGVSYDGTADYNGFYIYGGEKSWPLYRVILLDRAITNDQAALLRQVLYSTAPARCRLISLEYANVAIRYNASAVYDGAYNYGSS
ncbi:hypothetical protein ALP29_00216 [Pseudomonas syringae pv. avii]|uniref:Tail fiber protein n=1 Tax=Pseudomonas syringae pv. avii TaxID=663959 RepID=A0A3M5VHS5_PSESX|nr:phage tail protein [Pseudomonas azotoformans]RMT61664.1 hypothetical protein ALP43_03208 [Pseudomonas azotoformans]RMU57762.1 hypothetical protein ALP29_00216 [Pseudomonas syringae pv. avii]